MEPKSDLLLAFGCADSILTLDIRKAQVVKKYEGFHLDDINQVRFHPSRSLELFTGSMDGTITKLDLAQDEDDAMLVCKIELIISLR